MKATTSTTYRILSLAFLIAILVATIPAHAQFGGGNGSQASPYKISTAIHIQELADSVNLRNNWSKDNFFDLQNDISGVTSIIGYNDGTHNHAFQGNLEGNQHTITVNITGTNHQGTGLFGATYDASILRLTVAGNISGTGYTGGIIGDMHETELSNCINRANITVTATGASCVGGLAGCSSGGDISYCINAGTIYAPNTVQVGGLVGDRMAGTLKISNSLNIGTVTGNKNVGGISGGPSGNSPSAIFQNCINAGMIKGDESVGGITGTLKTSSSSISSSLNTGSVISGNVASSGGIVGNLAVGTVTGCYYDKQMCLLGGIKNSDVAGQAEGKLTAELCNINIGGSFTVTAGLYPQITALTSQTASKVAAAPAFLCAYDATDPDKANKVRRHFTVSTTGGVSWQSQNWHITFSGTEATLQSEGEEVLTAQANGWNKKVRVEVETTKDTCGNDVFYGCDAPVTVIVKTNPVAAGVSFHSHLNACDIGIANIGGNSGRIYTLIAERGTWFRMSMGGWNGCYGIINCTDDKGNVYNWGDAFLLTEDIVITVNWEERLFDLTLEAEPPAGGTVSGAGQHNTYCDNDDTATITATPNPGWVFLYWEDNSTTVITNVVYFNAIENIGVHHERKLTANFAPIDTGGGGPTTPQYKVILIGRGMINSASATLSGTGVYDSGTVLPIELTWIGDPWDPDCYTLCWRNMRGDIISTDNPTNITVISDTVLYAEYVQKEFTNSVVAGPGGTITNTTYPRHFEPISFCYTDDRACTSTDIWAVPHPCYKFVNWTNKYGDEIPETSKDRNLYICGATEADTITANFELKRIYLFTTYTNGGTATGSGTFYCGTTATLTATPDACCYQFAYWTDPSGAIVSNDNPFNFTIEDATPDTLILTANFELKPEQKTLNVTLGSGGKEVIGAGNISCGTSTKITAVPDSCYIFDNWTNASGQEISTDNPLQITVNCDNTLKANFIAHTYQLVTAVSSTNGTINLTGTNDVCPVPQKLIATPDHCYQFKSWTDKYGKVIGLEDTIEVVIKSDTTLTANFEKTKYSVTLTKNPDAGGTVSGSGNFYCDSSITITATENTGYTFKKWTKPDGTELSREKSYTFTLSQDTTLTAVFEPIDSITIILNYYPIGIDVELTGAGNYAVGSQVTIEATTTEPCYVFKEWAIAGAYGAAIGTEAANPHTFTISENLTFTANFTLIQYNLTVSATAGGTVSPAGTSVRNCNDTVAIEATPNDACYEFAAWVDGDGFFVSTDNPLIVEMARDTALRATFELLEYSLTLQADPAESGNVFGNGRYDCGTEIEIRAEADECYEFTGWSDGSPANPRPVRLLGDSTITANFALKQFELTLQAEPAEGGTVTGAGTFDCDAEVTITATPADNYTFLYWKDAETGETIYTSVAQVKMNKSKHWTAYFEVLPPDMFIVRLLADPVSSGILAGGGTHHEDTTIEISVAPAACFEFLEWTTTDGEFVTSELNFSHTVTQDTTFVAHFVPIYYNVELAVSPSDAGNISGAGEYQCGSKATAGAVFGTCYEFMNWTNNEGKVLSENPNYSFTLASDTNLTANFRTRIYTITTSVSPANSGSVAGGGKYNCGTEAILEATPNAGFEFLNWSSDNRVLSSANPLTLAVTGDSAIVANFVARKEDKIFIRLQAEPAAGAAELRGGGLYNTGEMVSLRANANANYTFKSWTDSNGTELSTANPYRIQVLQDSVIVAHFESILPNYTVFANAAPAEGGTVTGQGRYKENTEVTLEATAFACYKFKHWTTETGEIVSSENPLTFTIKCDTAFIAQFDLLRYEVEAQANPGNSGSVSGTGTYNCGQTAVLIAKPNPGFRFINWATIDSKILQNANDTLRILVASDTSVVANFAQEGVEVFILTLLAEPAGAGVLTGAGNYKINEIAKIAATENANYRFINWTDNAGNVVSNALQFDWIVKSDTTFVAHFEQVDLPVPTVNFTIKMSEHKQLDPRWQNYEIPIYITADADISDITVDELVVTLRKDIFYPRAVSSGNFSNILTETDRIITITDVKIPRLARGTEHVLTKIIGDVMLGSSDSSALVLSDNPLLPRADFVPTYALINGCITLEVCDFGEQRLVATGTGSPTLSVKNNPVKDMLELECSNLSAGDYTIEIMDLAGGMAKVAEFSVAEDANKYSLEVSVKDYVNGTYFVVVRSGIGQWVVKVVVGR